MIDQYMSYTAYKECNRDKSLGNLGQLLRVVFMPIMLYGDTADLKDLIDWEMNHDST